MKKILIVLLLITIVIVIFMTVFLLIVKSEKKAFSDDIYEAMPPLMISCEDVDRVLTATDPPQEGFDVVELQERLKELGYYYGTVSGIYDYETQKSVIRFHEENGLGSSSNVTAETWKALSQDVDIPAKKEEIKKPSNGKLKIVIDKTKNQLMLFVDGEIIKQYPVAIGKNNTPTPVGEFKVISKTLRPGGALGTRWMGLNVPWGTYGIHGTNKPWSIGRRASAGCIRMYNSHVEELFPLVEINTPVKIIGDYPPLGRPELKKGYSSQSLIPVQYKLRELGIYWGPADGRFGNMTAISIVYLQMLHSKEPTGELTEEIYSLLDLNN